MAGSSATGRDERVGRGRWLPPATVAALLAVIVAACGGGGLPLASGATATGTAGPTASPTVVASPSPSPSPSPSLTAQPTLEPATPVPTAAPTPAATPTGSSTAGGNGGVDDKALAAAGERLSNLKSYQFKIIARSTNVPQFSATGMDVTMTATIIREPTPAAHFLMVGKVEPMVGTLEAIIIGDKAWVRGGPTGDKWVAAPANEGGSVTKSMEQFDPGALYKSFGTEMIGKLTRVGPEDRNGVATIHYTIPAAALAGMGDDSGLTGDWTFDIWIAEQDAYLVAMEMHGQGVNEKGQEGELLISIENSHLDDPANVIEPPATKPGV